jgi:hypothetical protein
MVRSGAGVVQGVGEEPGQPEAFVELADGEHLGVTGELARRRREDEPGPEKAMTCRRADGILLGYIRGRKRT